MGSRRTSFSSLEISDNTLRNAIYQSNTVKVEVTSQIAQNNDRQSSLRREQPVLDRELQMLFEQVGRLKAEEMLDAFDRDWRSRYATDDRFELAIADDGQPMIVEK